MTIWQDPEVKAARDLNWVAVHHRHFVRRYTQQGDLPTANLCDRYARSFFDQARYRLRVVRRRRFRPWRLTVMVCRIAAAVIWIAVIAALMTASLWLS